MISNCWERPAGFKKWRNFVTDVDKYTEKFERKYLIEKKKYKHQAIPKNHQAQPFLKTAVIPR